MHFLNVCLDRRVFNTRVLLRLLFSFNRLFGPDDHLDWPLNFNNDLRLAPGPQLPLMKHCMTEFLAECPVRQKHADPFLDQRVLQNVSHGRSLRHVSLQQLGQQLAERLAEPRGQRLVLATDDLERQGVDHLGLEGRLQCAHLVEEHAQGPHIGLEAVREAFYYLGREVVWRANHGLGHVYRVAQDVGNAEVAQFDKTLLGQEDVLRLDVSVQDLSVVHVFHAETDLGEPVEDLLFFEELAFLLNYPLVQVSAICEVHHDAEVLVLAFVHFAELYDVWVVQCCQDLRFFKALLTVLLIHRLLRNLLNHTFLQVWCLAKEALAKGAFPQQFELLVLIAFLSHHFKSV